MINTITDPHTVIQGKIDQIAQDQTIHRELSIARGLLSCESVERVAGILSLQGDRTTMIDLEELLEPV